MKNPILIRPTGLEIRLKGIPQDEILDLGDLKLHRYNRFNIELLEGKKNMHSRVIAVRTTHQQLGVSILQQGMHD